MKRVFSFVLILLIFGIVDFSKRGFGQSSSNRTYGFEITYVYEDENILPDHRVKRVERRAGDSDNPSLAAVYLPLYWQGYLYSDSSADAEMGEAWPVKRPRFDISASTSVQCYDSNQSYISSWGGTVIIGLACAPNTPPDHPNPNSDIGLERGSFAESFSVIGMDVGNFYDLSAAIGNCTANSGATRTYSPTSIGSSSSSGGIGTMNPSTGSSSSVSSTINGNLSTYTIPVEDEE